MKELYERVDIKTEEDLPKESGYYFAHYTNASITTAHWHQNNIAWMEHYDWYLQPVVPEADQPHKSAEEILLKYTPYIPSYISFAHILEAMEEYASQKTDIPEITDEEIEKQFPMTDQPHKSAEEILLSGFKAYRRKQIAELRPFEEGEKLSNTVSVSQADKNAGSPKKGDMIARNPKNHDDQWLVAKQYFEDNFEFVKDNMLEEYANQKTDIPEITDSEIYEGWRSHLPFDIRWRGFSVGAKWYREELKRRHES